MYLDHFNEEDKDFVKKVAHLNGYFLTKFLDLNQQAIVQSLHPDASFYGGYQNSEMKRASGGVDDFKITCLKLEYDKRFKDINHRNILGSLLALGIEKDNIGDIIVAENTYVFVAEEIKDYIMMNLTINNLEVGFIEVDGSKIEYTPQLTQKKVFTQSLRLDSVVANVYNMSRNESKSLIQKGFIRVNHKLIENPTYQLKESDLVSVRKKGRFLVLEDIGKSRKDRHILNIGIY